MALAKAVAYDPKELVINGTDNGGIDLEPLTREIYRRLDTDGPGGSLGRVLHNGPRGNS